MKNFSKICVLILFTIVIFGLLPTGKNIDEAHNGAQIALAQTSNQKEYVVLAPLPGVGTESNGTTKISNLAQYITGMFKFLIGLTALLAVIMIIFGGIEYMTTDVISNKSAGKERIKNAILGLLLAVGSWLILNTIDPDILKIKIGDINTNLNTPAPQTNNAPAQPPPTTTTVGTDG